MTTTTTCFLRLGLLLFYFQLGSKNVQAFQISTVPSSHTPQNRQRPWQKQQKNQYSPSFINNDGPTIRSVILWGNRDERRRPSQEGTRTNNNANNDDTTEVLNRKMERLLARANIVTRQHPQNNSNQQQHHSRNHKNNNHPNDNKWQVAHQLGRILTRMEQEGSSAGGAVLSQPNAQSYRLVLRGWASTESREGVIRADQLLERMLLLEQQDDDQNQNNHMKVTLDDFAMVLLAWAKCRDYSKHDPTPAQKAQHWWSRMQDRLALLEQNTVNNHDMSLLADKEMEQKMVKTMRRSYNACLDAWAQRSGPHKKGQMAAQKALDLFETMQQNNNPDLSSSLSTQNQRNHPILQQVTPDAFSYSSVVTALTRLQTRADTAHAERLVDEMTSPSSLSSPHHNHTTTTTFIQPNVFLYTTLINGVAHSYQSLEGARKAEAILNRMSMPITGSGRNHLHPVQPNSHTYQGVLTAWGRSGCGIKGAKRCEEILNHMHDLYKEGNRALKPMINCYNAVLDAWSRSGGGVSAAQHAEAILSDMAKVGDVKPNARSIHSVLTAWAWSGAPNAAEKAEKMLQYFDELKQSDAEAYRDLQPELCSFNSVIHAYANSRRDDAARKAEAVLYRLIGSLGHGGGGTGISGDNAPTRDRRRMRSPPSPDAMSFGGVIHAWAKSKERGSEERAEQILEQMEKQYAAGNTRAKLDVIVYTTVISAWASKGNPVRAQRIFDRMKILATANDDPTLVPNTITYNALLSAWSKSNHENASKQALQLLDEIQESKIVKATCRTWNYVLLCLAKNSTETSALEAERLMNKMVKLYAGGNKHMRPDSFTFSSSISAWEQSKSKHAGEGILRIVDTMEQLYDPNVAASRLHVICFNSAIRYFVDIAKDPYAAEALLERMEKSYLNGQLEGQPDDLTYGAVLKVLANAGKPESAARALNVLDRMQNMYKSGNKAAKPNTICFNTVLTALARCSDRGSGLQSMNLLNKMKDMYIAGNVDMKPDVISYTSVIVSLFRSKENDAADIAMKLLSEMEEKAEVTWDPRIVPGSITFTTVLNFVSKGKTNSAAVQADKLLQHMEELHEKKSDIYTDVKPSVTNYVSVINAWASVSSWEGAQRAEEILRHMYSLKDDSLKPDIKCYNAVLSALFKSMDDANEEAPIYVAERAENILKEMEAKKVAPEVFSYKMVLLLYARSSNMVRANDILKQMEAKHAAGMLNTKPDAQCYEAVRMTKHVNVPVPGTQYSIDKKPKNTRTRNQINRAVDQTITIPSGSKPAIEENDQTSHNCK
eukprot:CAMPEP_0198303960 /NCGR_PEP_ID=MMETSP1449-20131203/57156_1 /TAXON_ID=420275 /ORGANISM="Attheya septentrionalis, Strain CCMP2084" /LENGTH=1280 /DNA_ID=CAMNT_0044006467 /DNA_START=542 /DNA_END=4384 /DNA_ORIENTATION=+